MRSRLRLSLGLFLLAIGIVGSGVGLYVRHLLSKPMYVTKVKQIERTKLYAAWTQTGYGRRQLQYLLVVPRGDMSMSGGSNWTTANAEERHISPDGLDLEALRFYLDGKLVPHSDDGRLWLFRTTNQTVEEIASDVSHDEITPEEFEHFEATPLWREKLKPQADAEGAEWWALVQAGKL